MTTKQTDVPLKQLPNDFRQHLERFYDRLNLAPPYNSIEKAIRCLSTVIQKTPKDEQAHISSETSRKWDLYLQAFVDSGLHHKHRGIIRHLARSHPEPDLPAEYKPFLSVICS